VEDEWDEDTEVTVFRSQPDEVTAPHAVTAGLAEAFEKGKEHGCRGCFQTGYDEGHADALVALRSLLLERGASNDHVVHVLAAVRKRFAPASV
jgi:hypothetical protein